MNYFKYDLSGQYPGNTYQNLVQYAVESSSFVDGIGNVIITPSGSISSSYAYTASFSLNGGGAGVISSGSYNISASWASQSLSASYVPNLYPQVTPTTIASASWVSASVKITTSDTASYITASNIVGTVVSASYVPNLYPQTVRVSSSWASASLSSSYSTTASFSLNGGSGTTLTTGSTYPITASWANNSVFTISASFSNTSSYLSLYDAGLASWVIITSNNGILTIS